MFFSVIIPVGNKAPHLDRSINSVLNQSFKDFELILIDDATTDGSAAKLAGFTDYRIRLLKRSQPGPGGYAARNLGIKESRTNWIAFLDADDELNELRNSIFNSCTLYILPMVNPDGAQVFSRRNAQGIDINRDFKKQQSPEGRILVEICDHIKPQYGFNLHDQSTIWSAGKTGNPATISMLAPAFDEKLRINDTRLKAMQVISLINKEIRQIIPDHVGRFKDDFEPRAFGDNFQALDISTILIEAGGYADDSEKQFIRKLYFKAILKGLEVIAFNSHLTENSEDYFSIPENEKLHFQILLKNCELLCNGLSYQADIGLIAVEDADEDCRSVSYTYIIEDIGDLDGFNGYETINVQGMELILIKPLICQENADFLIRDGMTTVLCIENGRITEKR